MLALEQAKSSVAGLWNALCSMPRLPQIRTVAGKLGL